mgnify:CR=1 FL=1
MTMEIKFANQQTYSKTIDLNEFMFTLTASKNGIAPPILSWRPIGHQFEIEMEPYPSILQYPNDFFSVYRAKVVQLIKKLHTLGIFHGDVVAENVLIEPITGNVLLINFNRSEWIVDRKNKPEYNYLYNKYLISSLERDEIMYVDRLEFF